MLNGNDIERALDAEIIVGEKLLSNPIISIYASDLMSDVLAFGEDGAILLTGLATIQATISAHMAEFVGVVFIRGKKPKQEIIDYARKYDLIILVTKLDMFEACCSVGNCQAGGKLKLPKTTETVNSMLVVKEYHIDGNDFANSGIISTNVKSFFKELGINRNIVRRAAISTYEAEMNVVMHADNGKVHVTVSSDKIMIVVEDTGKGILDVEQALTEGYSTATEDMRALGFGSGMGLPNIKRNADRLDITSKVGIGTCLKFEFDIKVNS